MGGGAGRRPHGSSISLDLGCPGLSLPSRLFLTRLCILPRDDLLVFHMKSIVLELSLYHLYDFCRFARALESLGLRASFRRISATRSSRSYSSKVFFSFGSCLMRDLAIASLIASAWPLTPPPCASTSISTFWAMLPARSNGSWMRKRSISFP